MSRFMRLIVFFDLPVATKTQKRVYTDFRRFLINDGYYMIQFSVYGRLCNSSEDVAKHESRLIANAPLSGSVRTLTVTEKQYAGIKVLSGKKKEREKNVKGFQMSFF